MKSLIRNSFLLLLFLMGGAILPCISFATLITIDQNILLDTGNSSDRSDDRYWIRNPGYFGGASFQEQMDSIAEINRNGTFSIVPDMAPWRMALEEDINSLTDQYSADQIWHAFIVNNDQGSELLIGGRYASGSSVQPGTHASMWVFQSWMNAPDITYGLRGGPGVPDQYDGYRLGAWVTADAMPVPEPATCGLFALGCLAFLVHRHKNGRIRIIFS